MLRLETKEKFLQVWVMLLQTSNTVATNDKNFKILENIADLYFQYKKNCNRMPMQPNYIRWVSLNKLENFF
jgi:hypothetical protein